MTLLTHLLAETSAPAAYGLVSGDGAFTVAAIVGTEMAAVALVGFFPRPLRWPVRLL